MDNQQRKDFWQNHIESCRQSWMSQREYCRANKLALSTFCYWKRKLDERDDGKVKFYPLSIPEEPSEPASSRLLLNVSDKRFNIEISNSFSSASLKQLIGVLEEL